jgi:signal transduction histidine kinase
VTALLGWALAAGLLVAIVRLRRRLELVAQATHELRGPAAALSFAAATLRREAGGVRRAIRFESELERLRAGLADLEAARRGQRAPARPRTVPLEQVLRGAAAGWRPSAAGAGRGLSVRWDAGPAANVRAERGRLAQAFGNLMANAVEHGSGPIEVRAVRKGKRAVRVEVRDGGAAVRSGRRRLSPPDRGRGLGIAGRAVREAGGSLRLERERGGTTTAAVELPLVESDPGGS